MSGMYRDRTRPFRPAALFALGLLVIGAAVPAAVRADEPTRYWVGIALQSPGEGDSGIRLQEVLPGSPGAKAGLREGDLLQKVSGEPIPDVATLQQRIQQSGGKPLAIQVLRNGERMTIKVVPAPRPEGGPYAVLGAGESGQEKAKPVEPLRAPKTPEAPASPSTAPARPFQPLLILPANPRVKAEPFPDDLMVVIQKKGNKPAQLKVAQGNQVWNIREDQTDQLPESIRGHVRRMIPGRGLAVRPMPGPDNLKFTAPQAYVVPKVAGADSPLLREVQELKKQMQVLEKKVDALSKGASAHVPGGNAPGEKPRGGKVRKPDGKQPAKKKLDTKKPDTKRLDKASK